MSTPLNIAQARFNMIEQQIRPWDVHDPWTTSSAKISYPKPSVRWPLSTWNCHCLMARPCCSPKWWRA